MVEPVVPQEKQQVKTGNLRGGHDMDSINTIATSLEVLH